MCVAVGGVGGGKSFQVCEAGHQPRKIRQGQIIWAPAEGLDFIPQVTESQKDSKQGSNLLNLRCHRIK